MKGKISGYKILVRKTVGKRLLRRPRQRWENNIKTCFKEIRCQGRDWINLSQDKQLVGWWFMVMKYHVPQNAGNFLTS
jgi:hypothetical protein